MSDLVESLDEAFDRWQAALNQELVEASDAAGQIRIEDAERIRSKYTRMVLLLFDRLEKRVARRYPEAVEIVRRELEPLREQLQRPIVDFLRPH